MQLNLNTSESHTRLGFHYFPDTLHYRANDLVTWLPRLQELGASWLTLLAPLERAIPEAFITGLLEAGIEPILHFCLPLGRQQPLAPLRLLFDQYQRWGVRYAAFFDRPNERQSWPSGSWAQADLVERFLDLFIPVATEAVQAGLQPAFPPLQPGGDYWDLAFLGAALAGIRRRSPHFLAQKLVLSAYGWTGNRPLEWGSGGPRSWPAVRPHSAQPRTQDHAGIHIYEWYLPIAESELGRTPDILLLRAGSRPGDSLDSSRPSVDEKDHARRNLELAGTLIGDGRFLNQKDAPREAFPSQVLACNFWLLAASESSPFASQAWFQPDGSELPVTPLFRRWWASRQVTIEPQAAGEAAVQPEMAANSSQLEERPIAHYLLLPLYAWGPAEWDLEAVQPYLLTHHPTVGFSIEEAALAGKVTVLGGESAYPTQVIERLKNAGCQVERLGKDGTILASVESNQ